MIKAVISLATALLVAEYPFPSVAAQRPPGSALELRESPRNFFPPWEGAGVYAFGPLLLDFNHHSERFMPEQLTPLIDCSTDEVFCLTSRRGNALGVVAFTAPRRCGNSLAVGDRWRNGDVSTVVLARIEPSQEPIRNSVDYHTRRATTLYYLGDDSNPRVVYEYTIGDGIVAILHGLTRYPNLVGDIKGGLDPASLPSQYRFRLSTLDRLAACRARAR